MTLETKLGYKIDFKTDGSIATFDIHELVCKKNNEYDLEISQSHTADQPTRS